MMDMSNIERFCEKARQNLQNFNYEDKRLALEALQVKIWIDGEAIEISGAIPISEGDIVTTTP